MCPNIAAEFKIVSFLGIPQVHGGGEDRGEKKRRDFRTSPAKEASGSVWDWNGERERKRERDSLASFYRGTDRPTTAAIEKSFPLSPRLSPMRRRRDGGNGRRPDQRRETTHHHHHSLSSEMEGWRDVGSLFSPRIYWITRRRPLRRSYVGKGCKLHPKSRMGGGREKRERCFFLEKTSSVFVCSQLIYKAALSAKRKLRRRRKKPLRSEKTFALQRMGEKEDKN